MTGLEHYHSREWFSVSSLVTASRCLRKYFYSSGCRLVPSGGEHVALLFGQAIHKALPAAYHQDLDRAFADFNSVWKDTPGDDKRNPVNAKLMLVDFALSHRPGYSFYTLLPPPRTDLEISDRVSDYEVPFALHIPGLPIPLVGRIDGLCRHRDTGELWALEYKTASELSQRFLSAFEWNTQVVAYTLALRVYTGETVRGCMVEALHVNKYKRNTQLQPVTVSDNQIEMFIRWAQFWGQAILECEKKGDFLQNASACNPYQQFGMPGYTCEYTYLCSQPDWTAMKDFYRVKEDRPFSTVSVAELPGDIPKKEMVQDGM
jgi:hypothetical protein